jgi:predicted alpha/beta-hydrolase family hydrolase
MKKTPNIYFHRNPKSDTLDIVLQGGSYPIESPFMQKVISTCIASGHSVAAFNFPYFERGESHSSGPQLKEELQAIQNALDFCNAEKYRHIRFVAKSLGAIAASYFLKNLPPKSRSKYSIVVLGYVLGSIDLKNFPGKIVIIQGQKDKFGNIAKVKANLKNAASKNITFIEIKGADHTYNDHMGKPTYHDEAIKALLV